MVLRFHRGLLLSFLLVSTAGLVSAQGQADTKQTAKREWHSTPFRAPSDAGYYKELNKLPEAYRRKSQFARYLHELKRIANDEGVVDHQSRLSSYEEAQAALNTAAFKQASGEHMIFADAWINIGPQNRGGCTKAIAVHPTDPNIVYAGAAGGGVWKSTNGGSAWAPLTDLVIPDLAVSTLAIDPQNPNIVYAGSGDASASVLSLFGTGLYKTTNAGSTWARIGSAQLPRTVNKVLVHPSNSDVVFACNYDGAGANSGRGLYRSTNGGTSFSRVHPTAANAQAVIWDVAIGQTSGGQTTLFLVEGNNYGGGSSEAGVYKSTDNGVTWTKLTTTTLPRSSKIGKSALAISQLNPTKIYCLMADSVGELLGLYRSTDNGTSFSKITVPSTLFNAGAGAQGWYDLTIGISQYSNTVDTIFIGGVEAYRSFNSGSSWTAYSDYNANEDVHVDHHAITFDPSNSKRVFIGTDGGIYRSTNSGQSWSYTNQNYHTMRFYHLGLDKGDFRRTLGGAQDQGTWQTYTGENAQFKFGGDGFNVLIDPSNSNIFYTEGPRGKLYRIIGANFSEITGSGFEEESGWDTPFIMAPKSSTVLYTGRTKVWRSGNSGDTWTAISPVFDADNPIRSLAVSPSNVNVIYAGLTSGRVRRTTDLGSNWSEVNTGAGGHVMSIACHPRNANWALISLASTSVSSSRVMLTTNGGTSWTNVSGSSSSTRLPGVPVSSVALDSNDPGNIWYAATDNGIYYTRNAGSSWSIAGSGLGLAPCREVQVHANKLTVRVATYGRSFWEANASILPVELSSLRATRTSGGTRLDWRTDTERHNSGFWVQRSYNYDTFEDLVFVTGAGTTSTPKEYTYFDPKHDAGYYIYRLKQIDLDGGEHLSNIVEVRYGSASIFRLDQNVPNPFVQGEGHSTRIRFALKSDDVVTLKIYSATGQLVRTLLQNAPIPGGEQDVQWDGRDENGVPVAIGVYQYSIELVSGEKLWNKMVVLAK